ncbi:hypothetical protein [Winogradskyella forsetii]|uniref:hypothetical protein n=1 Tax=Winogradskyella forsetii TaxID=2686077 RepID=UPI0015BDE8F6|nr:hypothetical protein [Winogradskyella forsetii]
MESLKLKIIDALVQNISILDFEQWLYNSEYLDSNLSSKSVIFEIVSINFKENDATKRLLEIAKKIFNEKEFETIKLEKNCKKIIDSNKPEEIIESILSIINDNDFECLILWDFYGLYYNFEGYEYQSYLGNDLNLLNLKSKELAQNTLKALSKFDSIKKKIEYLETPVQIENQSQKKTTKEVEKQKKETLIQKIFAFFKKS